MFVHFGWWVSFPSRLTSPQSLGINAKDQLKIAPGCHRQSCTVPNPGLFILNAHEKTLADMGRSHKEALEAIREAAAEGMVMELSMTTVRSIPEGT